MRAGDDKKITLFLLCVKNSFYSEFLHYKIRLKGKISPSLHIHV